MARDELATVKKQAVIFAPETHHVVARLVVPVAKGERRAFDFGRFRGRGQAEQLHAQQGREGEVGAIIALVDELDQDGKDRPVEFRHAAKHAPRQEGNVQMNSPVRGEAFIHGAGDVIEMRLTNIRRHSLRKPDPVRRNFQLPLKFLALDRRADGQLKRPRLAKGKAAGAGRPRVGCA